jgi:endogenous inhibitor of DNA gyrase (YacG/DUF329 family)
MAMLQLKCPETGKPIDLRDARPPRPNTLYNTGLWIEEIPCPHCGETHRWTKSQWVSAKEALRDSPDAARVLIDRNSVSTLP